MKSLLIKDLKKNTPENHPVLLKGDIGERKNM